MENAAFLQQVNRSFARAVHSNHKLPAKGGVRFTTCERGIFP